MPEQLNQLITSSEELIIPLLRVMLKKVMMSMKVKKITMSMRVKKTTMSMRVKTTTMNTVMVKKVQQLSRMTLTK